MIIQSKAYKFRLLSFLTGLALLFSQCNIFKQQNAVSPQALKELLLNGVSMRLLEQNPSSVEFLEAGLSADFFNPQFHYELARLRRQMNQPEAAWRHAQMAYRLKPTEKQYAYCYADYLQDNKNKLRFLEEACKRFPNDVKFRDNLLSQYIQLKSYSQGLRLCKTWLQHNPPDPTVLLSQSLFLKQNHQNHDAVLVLKQAEGLFPNHLDVLNALADGYEQQNDTDNLVRVCSRLVILNPKNTPAYGVLILQALKTQQFNLAKHYYALFLTCCDQKDWKFLLASLSEKVSKQDLLNEWILPNIPFIQTNELKFEMQKKAIELGISNSKKIQWMYQNQLGPQLCLSILDDELKSQQWDSLNRHARWIYLLYPELQATRFYLLRSGFMLNDVQQTQKLLMESSREIWELSQPRKTEYFLWQTVQSIILSDTLSWKNNLKLFKQLEPEHSIAFLMESWLQYKIHPQSTFTQPAIYALNLWDRSSWNEPYNIALEVLKKQEGFKSFTEQNLIRFDDPILKLKWQNLFKQ